MIKWKDMLGKALNTVEVVTFDNLYISGGKRKAPPKAEKLVEFHADVVKKAVEKCPGHPLILAGEIHRIKRCHFLLDCKILLKKLRGHVLVKGSKDWLCPLEELEAVRGRTKCTNELHVIDGGNNSFEIGKKHPQTMGSTQDKVEDLAVQAIAEFVCKSHEER